MKTLMTMTAAASLMTGAAFAGNLAGTTQYQCADGTIQNEPCVDGLVAAGSSMGVGPAIGAVVVAGALIAAAGGSSSTTTGDED